MNIIATGSLPSELVDAIRCGAVRLTRPNSNVIIFHDECSHFEWCCKLSVGDGEQVSYYHQRSGERGSARVPRIMLVNRLASTAKNDLHPVFSCKVPVTDLAAEDIVSRHRDVAMKVAHFLAPGPRDDREIFKNFTSTNTDALNLVLSAITTKNHRGQRELQIAGYELVDIESFGTRAIMQQVANSALPKIKENKALLDRFVLYADRDVMLAVCTRGIMAGLGNTKRPRGNDNDDGVGDDDYDDVMNSGEEAKRQKSLEPKINSVENVRLFTTIHQSDIRWSEGDLTRELWEMSPEAEEALAQLQSAAKKLHFSDSCLKPMPISNQAQLEVARTQYALLRTEYQVVHDRLRRLEEVSDKARDWCQEQGIRFTENLRMELKSWFEKQEEPKQRMLAALDTLHRELYGLKRNIEDYVNLREWGVLS
ncbi:hypothetical protein TRVL_03978 [Trypanosoma vivax]|uniref:Uncharacterized protein n=1 Tax=Trypanosoma vivax (strain Y486) TaxID=1055687 RepID=G0TUL5_TRYVY|nr:hypothetical protein TRVL_03978 [Trypanosoma vivax]CCC47650.1 conserved hypothetical protein [Trypanosoma vivax Y486]